MAKIANARVKLLDTIEPTSTDRNRYHAGTEWTFPIDRAVELEDAGKAEILETFDEPTPPVDPASAAAPAIDATDAEEN